MFRQVGEPRGGRSPLGLGAERDGGRDQELPAPSVSPVAYFLYSNKVEFDTVWVFYFRVQQGIGPGLGLRERGSPRDTGRSGMSHLGPTPPKAAACCKGMVQTL